MDNIALDSSFDLNGKALIKNRFFKSAMSEQLGDHKHDPTPGLINVYRAWAQGGTGISVTGNVMIDRTALGEPKNVVLDEHSDLALFSQWAQAGNENNGAIWMQLNHPGKQIPSFLSETPVAPSAISLGRGLEKAFNKPRALEDDEVLVIIRKFATAARLAKEAGFNGVQIHGAHGYLVSQFLSSRHNQRTDRWGGSLENRMRFVEEVYRAIRREVGEDYPVGIKLNSADYMKGGFSHEESMQVVAKLSSLGIDLIEISGGTYESPNMMGKETKPKGNDEAPKSEPKKASTIKREAYFLEYAESVRKLVDTPLVVTGGFRSSQSMLAALNSGATDFIGVARPLAIYPDLPNQLIDGAKSSIHIPRPSSGVKALDRMVMLDITWFESHIARVAKHKKIKPKLSAWRTVFEVFWGMGAHAFKQRRA